MRLLMTGRHVKVTSALKRHVEARIVRLERYGAELGDVQVVIGVEKYRHSAEAKLTLNGIAIQAKTSTNEMYASIDLLLDKIARQIAKRKDKLVSHKPRPVSRRPLSKPRQGRAKIPTIAIVQAPLLTLTVDEAVERLRPEPSSFTVFLNVSLDRIQVVRRLDNGGVELIDPQPVSPWGG
jgi:putative sigma-54 modulation protein